MPIIGRSSRVAPCHLRISISICSPRISGKYWHALFTRARQYLPDILGEQIEIEIRKWHGATREDLPIIGIVAALFMDRWGDQGCSSANAITASIRSSSSHTLESSIWGGDEPVKVAHRPLTSEHLLIS